MKKDIEIPIAKNVYVAIAREWNDDFLSKDWNAYLINDREDQIEMVMVVSNGFDEHKKTSTMRHGIGAVGPKSFAKIELLQEEVLSLNNEFFVTFFAEGKLFEKRFLFPKYSVKENAIKHIPIIDREGVLSE